MYPNKVPLWLVKLTRYEFWPVYVFYGPFFFYWLYLCFKARDFGYLFRINPAMKLGGAIGADKVDSLVQIDKRYLPTTALIDKGSSLVEVNQLIDKHDLKYPLIIKPNNGERGKGVEKICSQNELNSYLNNHETDLILQEFIDSPQEIGVFYYKDPYSGKGQITSVVVKRFLSVVGNGLLTLEQLMQNNLRARFRIEYLKSKYAKYLNRILDEGEVMFLEPVGNHCRGTEFLSGQHIINDDLVKVFDEITKDFEGFDYGRFDLKINSLEELYKGHGIKILEVNGVNAEPAHVYDKSYNLLKAYKDVKMHLDIIFSIYTAKYKHKPNGLPLKQIVRDIKAHFNPHLS
ncbi:MAG: hypothetical protein JXQ87_04840 [Bacteroidia bacterium]